MALALEKTMKLCRGFSLFTTTQRTTPLSRLWLGYFAGVLLLGPAELSAQWLDYRGGVDGSFTTTCRTGAGDTPWSGEVIFNFSAGESIANLWRGVEGAGKVAADGNSSGSVRMLNGPVDWRGQFTRRSDGSIHGEGRIDPKPGEFGCSGSWIADRAANPGQPNQPAAPTGESQVCANYRASIKRIHDEVNRILYVFNYSSALSGYSVDLNPSQQLSLARSKVQEISHDITSAGGSPSVIEEQRELRGKQYARIKELKAVIQRLEGKKNDIRRLRSEANAAGCALEEGEADSPKGGDLIDELIELDYRAAPATSPPEQMIGVAGVEGSVEVETSDSKGPLTNGTRIPVNKKITIRTGPMSSVTIQVGSVRKTLDPLTIIRIAPGQPDVIEQGEVTVDVRKPGPSQIRTPTATAKVGGTVFTVSYDASTRTTGVMVEEGSVSVLPTNPSVRGVMLAPGEYVEVSSDAMTVVLPAPGAPETRVGGTPTGPNPTGNSPVNPQGLDLTGLWKDDTGGGAIYHVRQVGNRVYWIVDGTPMGSFVNLSYGEISGNTITGIWVDLPGSPSLGGGNLTLRIESNDRLVKVSSNPYYGAQAWTRQGSTSTTGGAIPGSGSGGEIWRYESDGGWSGTWTRRGTTDVFDSQLRANGSAQQNILEKVTIEGRRFHSERLQSSDGHLCMLDGTLESDNRTYSGTGSCPGGPSGWQWTLIRPTASAGLMRATPPPSDTRVWHYQSEGGWSGTWTRRGTSNLYDSDLQGGEHQTIVEQVTFEGNRVHAQRIESSDGKLCTLEGTLQPDGQTYQGTAQCPGGPNGWWWRIRP
jgi:hypothetical protein